MTLEYEIAEEALTYDSDNIATELENRILK